MPSLATANQAVSKQSSHVWQRLYKNTAALGFAQIVNMAGNLLLVPLFLSYWSKEVYGEWIALSALVAYFSVADTGMNSASGNAMIQAYQRRDWEQYRGIQASALVFFIGMASAATAVAVAACVFLPVSQWLGVTHIQSASASIVICLLAGRILWQMPAGQIWNIFRTTGDLATSQWIANLQTIGIIGATAIALWLGSSVATLAAWTCLPLLVCAPTAWLLVRRSHKELLPHLRSASVKEIKILIKPSMLFALIMLATAINMNGPVILVAPLLGGAAVAVLVTARALANVARMVPTILCWALWPELTRLEAVGDRGGLRTALGLLVASYLWISIAFAGAFWFEGSGLIELWTRGRLSVQPWLVRAFLLYVLCQAPWIASSMLAWATNRHRKMAWCQLLAGVGGLVFIAVLLPRLKLVAVPLGLLAGEAFACYHFVIADACALTDTPYRPFAARVWSTLAVVTALTLAASAAAHHLPIGFVPLRVVVAGIVSVITAAIGVWEFLLDKSGRLLVAGRFTRNARGSFETSGDPARGAAH